MTAMLLVMDMLNDLVHENGGGAKTYVPLMKERNVLARTRAAIDRARAAGALIGYVRIGFSPDYRECPPNSPVFSRARSAGMFKLGTWGTEVHPDVAPQPSDFDIVKHRVSPFYGTSLEPFLCGVSTNGVVHSGAREGHDRDYACTVLEDCCAGATVDEHESALRCVGRFAAIKNSAEVTFS
jgi:nicotinamidase-related amidase